MIARSSAQVCKWGYVSAMSSPAWPHLRKVYERLPAGGALLVAEKLLADDRSGPRWAVMQSLNMLVCTEGKERTLGEYAELLKEAGFARVEGRRTDSPLGAVLAVKEG